MAQYGNNKLSEYSISCSNEISCLKTKSCICKAYIMIHLNPVTGRANRRPNSQLVLPRKCKV